MCDVSMRDVQGNPMWVLVNKVTRASAMTLKGAFRAPVWAVKTKMKCQDPLKGLSMLKQSLLISSMLIKLHWILRFIYPVAVHRFTSRAYK